jgi:hypothetical protein
MMALSGHLGREKTYSSVSRTYWWPKLFKWTSTYVRTCRRVNGGSLHRMRLRLWQVCLYPRCVWSP